MHTAPGWELDWRATTVDDACSLPMLAPGCRAYGSVVAFRSSDFAIIVGFKGPCAEDALTFGKLLAVRIGAHLAACVETRVEAR